jgi:hypothetical protein
VLQVLQPEHSEQVVSMPVLGLLAVLGLRLVVLVVVLGLQLVEVRVLVFAVVVVLQ